MKIQCDVCEKAEAAVVCCADEAALCWRCDEHVHAANKLAGKHQRIPLLPNPSSSSSSKTQLPTCDICQEKAGYFFCLEDRALLCRNCDFSIHTASPYVSSHQRFLITGTKVALHHYLAGSGHDCSSSSNHNDKSNSTSSNGNSSDPISALAPTNNSTPNWKLRARPTGATATGEVEDLGTQWPWNELLDLSELELCNSFSKPDSSC